MKSFILKTINRLGYVLIRIEEWQAVQKRLHVMADTKSASQQLADSQHLLTECRTQLVSCMSENDVLSIKVSRANLAVETLRRAQKSLQAVVGESRAQLARADTSGRIADLEGEKIRLAQRISDLETYLKETRGGSHTYL